MTVRRKSYRPYTGSRKSGASKTMAIARHELALAMRQRWVKRLLIAGAVPLIALAVMLYFKVVVEGTLRTPIIEVDALGFLYKAQVFFIVLMMAAAGSGLVAKDASSQAHQLYFSRPITALQYCFGKMASVAFLVFALTLVPGWLLCLVQLVLSPDPDYGEFSVKLLQITLYATALSAACSAIISCISAYGTQSRYIGVIWVGLYFFTIAISGALQASSDAAWISLVSIEGLFVNAGYFFYDPSEAEAGAWGLVLLLGLGALSFVFLVRRVSYLRHREV